MTQPDDNLTPGEVAVRKQQWNEGNEAMSEPFTIEEALEAARAHSTAAARIASECEADGNEALMKLAEEHTRTGLTLRAFADAEKRAEEVRRENVKLLRDLVDADNKLREVSWRCFQCDAVFYAWQRDDAREHFGGDSSQPASCVRKLTEEIERLKRRVRDHWEHRISAAPECHANILGSIQQQMDACLAAAPSPEGKQTIGEIIREELNRG